jgi:GTP pyrophosphokinase
MIHLKDIIDNVLRHHPEADVEIIEKAYAYSAEVHDGVKWVSGKPSLPHSMEVANILADMNLDAVSVAAGLIHDVLEDTRATEPELRTRFGEEISRLISGVTRISSLPIHRPDRAKQAENIRKMILAMADDIRVILIKLADRLHNMRFIRHFPPDLQTGISKETLDIYSPIAARLGIYWIKSELDMASFRYVYPEAYKTIKARVNKGRGEREQYIEKVKQILHRELADRGVSCEVMGRYKNYYSIYTKMVEQNLPFEEIYDIIAFRIIVETIPQCYEVLGLAHSMWKPIPKKFKDYIGFPKPNMYQSLHTTVVGPLKDRIEIQIRTREMDAVAKSGIAAHWSYKEGNIADQAVASQFSWIQNLVENQTSVQDPGEFLENVRIDLFPDDVYVMTPDGEIKAIPKGATPVDFAYLIHSEVGNRCTGAKVDGRMVPLNYELQTGSRVEIITTKGHRPSKDWLKFVKTVKARSRIRQWIKNEDRERSLTLGRELCEKMFRKHRLNFNKLLKSDRMSEAVASFKFKNVDDLIASIGYGKITPLQLIRRIAPKPEDQETPSKLTRVVDRVRKKREKSGVLVNGIEDMLIRFGKCCRPVPGDPITGYITRGQGVTVHRVGCANALKINPERRVEVTWSGDGTGSYPVKIMLLADDRVGLLADIATTISKQGTNILTADSSVRQNKSVDLLFTILVKDTTQLESVISALLRLKPVRSARRADA